MEQNPYEAPREIGNRPSFNWRWLCFRGLWLTGGSFAALLIFATMSPKPRTIAMDFLFYSVMVIDFGLIAGVAIAVIGGIGWALNGSAGVGSSPDSN
jgi:hypothetical protein